MLRTKTRVHYIPDPNDSEAKKWLCGALNRSGMTQSELADKLHTTRQAISKLMNGHTELTFVKIIAICYVCELDFEDPEQVWKTINDKEETA